MSPLLLLAPLLLAALGVAALRVIEPRLIYKPPKLSAAELDALIHEAGATPLTLTTSDGLRLRALGAGLERPKLVVLFSGNGSCPGQRPTRYSRFLGWGLGVLHPSYRGYPGSEGRPSEAGLVRDAEAAWAEARRQHDPKDLVVFGKSLGGGVAIALVSRLPPEEQPAALIIESSFSAIWRVAEEEFPGLPARHLMVTRFESAERAAKITCPTLIVHGDQDERIPLAHGAALAAAAPDARLHVVKGGDHNSDLLLDAEAERAAGAFVRSALGLG
ncbi:alpha/beta hydrolase [Myxococcota bacterium]|nr:alpha/beta hydrolase [Myxococcota bacterium]